MPDLFGPIQHVTITGTLWLLVAPPLAAAVFCAWRAIAAALCILLTFRYLWWHATLGMPKGQTLPQQVWAWIFFLFESMTNLSSVIVFFFLSRTKDRSADADAAQNSPLLEAPVDVFIVTYNEPVSVLERTIIGAKAITHSLRSSFSRVESPAWRRSSAACGSKRAR